MKQAKQILKDVFGYSDFRHNQEMVIKLSFSISENRANQEIVIFASANNLIIQDGGAAEVELQLAPVGGSGGGY